MLFMPNVEKYKIYAAYAKCGKILQGKGSQIQINNKTIIEFGFGRI